MKIKGYVVHVSDLWQFNESSNDLIKYLLKTIPLGSNYSETKDGIFVTNSWYEDVKPDQNLGFFAKLRGVCTDCKVVLREEQSMLLIEIMNGNLTNKKIRMNHKINEYQYETDGDIIKGYKVRCIDLQEIKKDKDNFFFTKPLGSNCINYEDVDIPPCKEYIFDDSFPKPHRVIHTILYRRCVKDQLQQSWYYRSLHPNHYLLLSEKQYNAMKQLVKDQGLDDFNVIICHSNPVDQDQIKPRDNCSCILS